MTKVYIAGAIPEVGLNLLKEQTCMMARGLLIKKP